MADFYPAHPGGVLHEDFLKQLGHSQYALVKAIRCSTRYMVLNLMLTDTDGSDLIDAVDDVVQSHSGLLSHETTRRSFARPSPRQVSQDRS